MKKLFLILVLMAVINSMKAQNTPLKVAIAGLTHDHVHGILANINSGDFELIGIAESDEALVKKYATRYAFSMDIVYPDLETLLKHVSPEAVCAFNSIKEHLEVVEICAPKGIHVMVEKPLAVSLDDARKMEKLAKANNIELITNYETTWYPSNHKIKEILQNENDTYGDIRKIVIHDGHQGPKEIGVSEEFLNWLTDPVYNGAGALIDFGCYGANLSTWLHNGERPISVTAISQQIKPHIYPKVDDETTIILTYPKSQSIIQASWNWSFGRKDMAVYTERGYLNALNKRELETRPSESSETKKVILADLKKPFNDSYPYLKSLIQEGIPTAQNDLSSLENNMVVMQILEAAIISAKEGRTFYLSEFDR